MPWSRRVHLLEGDVSNAVRRTDTLVKRILRKHGYPPDKQEKSMQTVLEQAALLSGEWATT